MKKILVVGLCVILAFASYCATQVMNYINDWSVETSLKTNKTNNYPVLELLQDEIIVSSASSSIDLAQIIKSATDEEDGDLIDAVVYDELDLTKIGEQTITFSVTDSDGNTTTKNLKVNVIDAPIQENDLTETEQ